MTAQTPGPLPDSAYSALAQALAATIPASRLISDRLRLLAYGTDASFYRLVPRLAVRVESEEEVRTVLAECRARRLPVTFRASGTSLSGQAVTDSVLLLMGEGWDGVSIERQGGAIRLKPGVIGAEANRRLAAFSRKIGPDPASIDSARIGGIAANNSSGMCCGTADNSYQTLLSMRVILADGSVLDTGDETSRAAFRRSHGALLDRLEQMGRDCRADTALAERIRRKFSIKNTTGYAINALVDFTDPIDILQHLMIGSEGTLGFIAEITYRTVPEHADKASALLLFPDIAEACRAVALLKTAPVAAVELMDRAALRSVEGKPGMPPEISGLPDGTTALLVESRAETPEGLAANIRGIGAVLGDVATLAPPAFTADPAEFGKLWKIRKGLFPAVGAVRAAGTTVIIEDVAFPIAHLAEATVALQELFQRHGYHEAIIFGHALDGNLHFVFTQDFGRDAEVTRYAAFMDDVARLVVERYDGSLKAEHGTGRNMAPFVIQEWGQQATALMWDIKALLDPEELLNPGVVLNRDPKAHLSHLKPLPPADPLVDTCIECGFCERMCPSHQLTLSPRQRITGWREISRAAAAGEDIAEMSRLYDYQGLDTCAACGLCATACPVGIETGRLTKSLRARRRGPLSRAIAALSARHYGTLLGAARLGLRAASLVSPLLVSRRLPAAAPAPRPLPGGDGEPVVYLPSCATRTMGEPAGEGLPQIMDRLLRRAGFRPILPAGLGNLCCGLTWESKGFPDSADTKAEELEQALFAASEGGRLPVVIDASACALRLRNRLAQRLTVLDSVEFLHDRVLPRLQVTRTKAPLLLHLNCSARRLGEEDKLRALAAALSEQVVVPEGVGCCGFAGDKGFTTPELNAHALRRLPGQVPAGCVEGVSSNRTCEIGLSWHSGLPYRSIASLLERQSRREAAP